ncbi:BCCT family transporter [Falsiroseomonas selenitidurans]|uniref:BCCT family transporter n=1 Tax=Falsiroseomonas selenitidurans TaxID=2716335 RepID=A0ABX1DWN4_9PROT|nr:BCCT family transporter [Falsiroseomonas selenitidurans]NKC29313.1 BCCT family transporter [Falsiroseomonas selenitidurans]
MAEAPAIPPRRGLCWPVFLASGAVLLALVLFAGLWPERAAAAFSRGQAWVIGHFGWFYMLAVAIFLLVAIMLAFGRHGSVRLGADDETPEFDNGSWFAMLFSAGMGIGLMFFGVAEPVMHYATPPPGTLATPQSFGAAREAMISTFFHWGLHAWAVYAMVGLVLAYFGFRRGLPLTLRSALYPFLGERFRGWPGHAVDTFAVIGTMLGVATSLGYGAAQANAGLAHLTGMPTGPWVQVVLIIGIIGIALGSVLLGLDAGIRRLSILNLVLAGALMGFVLATGPTLFLVQAFVQNTGAYLADIVGRTFRLHAYEPSGWLGGWTLLYWAWWIAWSPFVGMFIARVSRGRTIKEFVLGVLVAPAGFTFAWMTIFGNTAIQMDMAQGGWLSAAVGADVTTALFRFLDALPLSAISGWVATLLIVTFFVTSADSAALVVDTIASGGSEENPVWQRIFWCVSIGALAAVLLLAGGLSALQTASLIGALPFTAIMLVACWGLVRSLGEEEAARTGLVPARAPAAAEGWQRRLGAALHRPSRGTAERHLDAAVRPALEAVAEELRKRGAQTELATGDGRTQLAAELPGGARFTYAVQLRPMKEAAFALAGAQPTEASRHRWWRAEVAGAGYDVFGWTREDIIGDVMGVMDRALARKNR